MPRSLLCGRRSSDPHAANRGIRESCRAKGPAQAQRYWSIRIRLELGERRRELALFNLAIDSKLRGCDLVRLRVRDIARGDRIAARAIVLQRKTQRPVQFEITEPTRKAVLTWTRCAGLKNEDYLFPSRLRGSPHLSTRQYARIVEAWVKEIGLDPSAYGTHTMRRTKASRHVRNRVERIARELRAGGLKPAPGKAKLLKTRRDVIEGWHTVADAFLEAGQGAIAERIWGFIGGMRPPLTTDEQLAAKLAERTRIRDREREHAGANPVIRVARIPLISTSQGQVP